MDRRLNDTEKQPAAVSASATGVGAVAVIDEGLGNYLRFTATGTTIQTLSGRINVLTPTPEPSTYALMLTGLAGLACRPSVRRG